MVPRRVDEAGRGGGSAGRARRGTTVPGANVLRLEPLLLLFVWRPLKAAALRDVVRAGPAVDARPAVSKGPGCVLRVAPLLLQPVEFLRRKVRLVRLAARRSAPP